MYQLLLNRLSAGHHHRQATTASHALIAAGHSVHFDSALNMLATPDSKRDTALRYLAQLGETTASLHNPPT